MTCFYMPGLGPARAAHARVCASVRERAHVLTGLHARLTAKPHVTSSSGGGRRGDGDGKEKKERKEKKKERQKERRKRKNKRKTERKKERKKKRKKERKKDRKKEKERKA